MTDSAPELNIADVLRHYGATKVPEGAGWHSMRCPFHSDGHASGRVNTDLGAYKCNACPVSGDALKLISLAEKIGRSEAVDYARETLGASLTGVPRPVRQQSQRRPLGREKWKGILA